MIVKKLEIKKNLQNSGIINEKKLKNQKKTENIKETRKETYIKKKADTGRQQSQTKTKLCKQLLL